MSENRTENFRASEPKEDQAKNFSKVRFLQIQGLLTRKFSNGKLESQSPWSLRLILYFSLVSKFYFSLKPAISIFFPRNHIAQLYIGRRDRDREIDIPKPILTFQLILHPS